MVVTGMVATMAKISIAIGIHSGRYVAPMLMPTSAVTSPARPALKVGRRKLATLRGTTAASPGPPGRAIGAERE